MSGVGKKEATIAMMSCLLIMTLILMASWASDSRMALLPWPPRFVGEWADLHPNGRTGFPLEGLSLLLVFIFSRSVVQCRFFVTAVVGNFVLEVTEAGKLFPPNRTADWRDLGWGTADFISVLLLAPIPLKWRTRS